MTDANIVPSEPSTQTQQALFALGAPVAAAGLWLFLTAGSKWGFVLGGAGALWMLAWEPPWPEDGDSA